MRRTPRNYDGSALTTHRLAGLLPAILSNISSSRHDHSDLILAAWPEVVGPRHASMSEAHAFKDGILFVKIKNSTSHSVLSLEKPQLLKVLRQRFPKVKIFNIFFRIG